MTPMLGLISKNKNSFSTFLVEEQKITNRNQVKNSQKSRKLINIHYVIKMFKDLFFIKSYLFISCYLIIKPTQILIKTLKNLLLPSDGNPFFFHAKSLFFYIAGMSKSIHRDQRMGSDLSFSQKIKILGFINRNP